ncbi:hypothetical protein EV122DRAFT_284937 [Schizophyllum commune]
MDHYWYGSECSGDVFCPALLLKTMQNDLYMLWHNSQERPPYPAALPSATPRAASASRRGIGGRLCARLGRLLPPIFHFSWAALGPRSPPTSRSDGGPGLEAWTGPARKYFTERPSAFNLNPDSIVSHVNDATTSEAGVVVLATTIRLPRRIHQHH